MADDIARIIFDSAQTMEQQYYSTVVTDTGAPSGFQVLGLEPGSSIHFHDIEAAVNCLHHRAFSRLEENEENRWLLSYNGRPLPDKNAIVGPGLTVGVFATNNHIAITQTYPRASIICHQERDPGVELVEALVERSHQHEHTARHYPSIATIRLLPEPAISAHGVEQNYAIYGLGTLLPRHVSVMVDAVNELTAQGYKRMRQDDEVKWTAFLNRAVNFVPDSGYQYCCGKINSIYSKASLDQ